MCGMCVVCEYLEHCGRFEIYLKQCRLMGKGDCDNDVTASRTNGTSILECIVAEFSFVFFILLFINTFWTSDIIKAIRLHNI